MTSQQLSEIVGQRMSDPTVMGRIAGNLRGADGLEQQHHDGRSFTVQAEDCGDYWRYIVADTAGRRLAQVDVHENATVRADAFEPCRVTVSPEEGLLCVTRYRLAA